MKTVKRWKFLNGNKSQSGNHTWIMKKWYKVKGELDLCSNGFHASARIIDALGYVNTVTLAQVECRGESISGQDKTKECWQEMRVVKKYTISKEHFVKMSIFSAELVLEYFEKQYCNDNRPRLAIKAAKNYIKNPTNENQTAAWSARSAAESAAESAARSAESAARSAARSAAWSAESAARSAARSTAWSAARSAAWSAESAAWSSTWSAESAAWSSTWSAESAAWSAAWSAELTKTKDKIEAWILKNWIKEK